MLLLLCSFWALFVSSFFVSSLFVSSFLCPSLLVLLVFSGKRMPKVSPLCQARPPLSQTFAFSRALSLFCWPIPPSHTPYSACLATLGFPSWGLPLPLAGSIGGQDRPPGCWVGLPLTSKLLRLVDSQRETRRHIFPR